MTSEARGPLERCDQYARDVLSGAIVACDKVRRACQRYFDDLEKSKSPAYPWRFDRARAERPVLFMEKFLKPTKGDYDALTLLPWQCFVQCQLYGWVSKETGYRRFREGLILVGGGNGKSTMVSGNATYAACKDGEPGADVYLLANSKDQARIVYDECLKQIEASPALAPRFRTTRDGVYYDRANASIRARASDSRKLDGLNPHLAIFDEIHEYRDFKLINIFNRKKVKRRQPLTLYITTMGNVIDGPLAYYYALFSDALIDGKLPAEIADRLFGYICELDATDDVEDSRAWIKANPSLGVLLNLADMQQTWAKNRLIPAERADFICKQLNIMVNADDMAFVQPEVIRRNTRTIGEETLLGRSCCGGFDLSTREDFTAAALEFMLDDGSVFVLQHTWIPRRKVELDNEKIDYWGMAMRGSLSIVEGEYVQQEDVYQWFLEQSKKYEILAIGYDPANATQLRQLLTAYGFDMRVVRQGPLTLNDPMKDIKELLMDGKVIHNNDALFSWYVDNVRISADRRHLDKENWMPMKRNRYRKIDGFMAWLDAHCIQMQLNPAGTATNEIKFEYYEL